VLTPLRFIYGNIVPNYMSGLGDDGKKQWLSELLT
jgi:hypothetical protein